MGSLISAQRGCTPPLLGVTGKAWCLAPGSLLLICRPAIEGLNSEKHGRACLVTGFWHFQSTGWPLPKFGFLSRRSSWDFWCDRSVCVWLTRGQGFLRDMRPHEHCKILSAAGLYLVPFWKLEGLAAWLAALGARGGKAVGFAN